MIYKPYFTERSCQTLSIFLRNSFYLCHAVYKSNVISVLSGTRIGHNLNIYQCVFAVDTGTYWLKFFQRMYLNQRQCWFLDENNRISCKCISFPLDWIEILLNGRSSVHETVGLVRYLHLGFEERLLASYIMGYVFCVPVIVYVCNGLMYFELEL